MGRGTMEGPARLPPPRQDDLLIFHLDTSVIGGAERFLENIAVAHRGSVTVATLRRPKLTWPERVNWIVPPVVPPRLDAVIGVGLSGVLGMLYLFAYVLYRVVTQHSKYDVVINDQLAFINPFLRLIVRRVIFYCHFPEPLLQDQNSRSVAYRTYRTILNGLDHHGMKSADTVFCNSNFTLLNFLETYGPMHKPLILYPCVSYDMLEHRVGSADERVRDSQCAGENFRPEGDIFVLSLNRFESKKRHDRAIRAFFLYLCAHYKPAHRLVCCGGANDSSRLCIQELRNLARHLASQLDLICARCGEQHAVLFLTNCTDQTRRSLLANCRGSIYTPSNEHFGIVPLESMAYGKPVIAMASGGPQETVIDNVTGWLVREDSRESQTMADAIEKLFAHTEEMSDACRRRAKEFSFDSFAASVARWIR